MTVHSWRGKHKCAVDRLREVRAAGRRRAVIVLATGLGKTWPAMFDYAQLREELGRCRRLLFLAPRGELLKQAARPYRRLLRFLDETTTVGWFAGDDYELNVELVFASIAKLSRREHLPRLHSQHFDYIVVDKAPRCC